MSNDDHHSNRRQFLKTGALGLGALMTRRLSSVPRSIKTQPRIQLNKPIETVKMGIVGVGMQGSGHVRNFLNIDGVEIRAVGDIIPEKVKKIQKWVTGAGFSEPRGYSRGERDYERMCAEEDLDLVFTATPWNWHVKIGVAAMTHGKHFATEVPASVTIDESWELVETAEKNKKHCVMMENCCYSRHALMTLNMARRGLFGELLHGAGGYLHDLRNYKLGGLYENDWRVVHSMKRNGNLYPTHGIGPIAQCMGINRGDQFDYLVSMSTPSRGLQQYATSRLGKDHKFANTQFQLGDINSTLIKTKRGRTIYLSHDTNLPRPYSRIDLLQGTKGITEGYPSRFHLEGRSEGHGWDLLEKYAGEFEHPLWKNIAEKAKGAGHGGMDYIEDYRLIRSLQTGTAMDMDVYDAAAWSVISELTEISVRNGSKPVPFPDFTRGMWQKRKALGVIAD